MKSDLWNLACESGCPAVPNMKIDLRRRKPELKIDRRRIKCESGCATPTPPQ